jgi:hypothetical protein
MKPHFPPLLLGALLPLAALTGCLHVKTDPIRVEPIEINMNVNVRVAQELDSFFGDLDAESQVMEKAPASAPASDSQ